MQLHRNSVSLRGGFLQVVVGRQGDQLLTSEAGEVTRCARRQC